MSNNANVLPTSQIGLHGSLRRSQTDKQIRGMILDWLETEHMDLARASFILHMSENALLTILNGGVISDVHYYLFQTYVPGVE